MKDEETGMQAETIQILGIVIAAIVAAVLFIWILWQILRKKETPLDEMEGVEFEQYCAELLRNRGFIDVKLTKASGDFGVDILAEKDGVTYAIQCKRYADPVGVKAVQEAFAGREYYDRMVGAVLTNQYFTPAARKLADKIGVVLWDRDMLEELL